MTNVVITGIRAPFAVVGAFLFLLLHLALFYVESMAAILWLPIVVLLKPREELKESWPFSFPFFARHGFRYSLIFQVMPLNEGLTEIWDWAFQW